MSTGVCALLLALAASVGVQAAEVGNRLTYLDEFCDPYYAELHTPKLVTPQWVGDAHRRALRRRRAPEPIVTETLIQRDDPSTFV